MCGRLNCYCKYSSYSDRVAKKLLGEPPDWVYPEKFHPSPNVAPTLFVPVLHADDNGRLLVRAMKWGIVMPNVPGQVHNVRLETLSSSRFFRKLTFEGRTCAVLCDGFYEWKGRRAFFFYDGDGAFDSSRVAEWSEDDWVERGPPVMVLAGVFHQDEEYSCSVITRDATRTSEVHHRITISLSNKEEILSWLSSKQPPETKLAQLSDITNQTLAYYEVNEKVNSSKYQGRDCHFPKSKTSGPLDSWFTHSKPPPSTAETSRKRKNPDDFPSSSVKVVPSTTKKTPKKPSSGPLDRWFSKTKKPP